jgi:peroxiredoxin
MSRHSLAARRSLCLAALLGLSLCLAACGGRQSLEVGRRAPVFSLPDVEGTPVSLAGLEGKVVLLNFWALWCEPCKAEMPDFQAAQDRYGPQGFAVVTVDLGDRADKVKAFVEEKGFSFTVLVDSSMKVGEAYDARILPKSLLLDRQGTVRLVHETPFEPGQLAAQVEALLAEEAK